MTNLPLPAQPAPSFSTASKAPLMARDADPAAIRRSAEEFEAVFLTQILSDAGFGKAITGGLGGAAENFGSFILQAYAQKIAEAGGVGLAAIIEAQLLNEAGDAGKQGNNDG